MSLTFQLLLVTNVRGKFYFILFHFIYLFIFSLGGGGGAIPNYVPDVHLSIQVGFGLAI